MATTPGRKRKRDALQGPWLVTFVCEPWGITFDRVLTGAETSLDTLESAVRHKLQLSPDTNLKFVHLRDSDRVKLDDDDDFLAFLTSTRHYAHSRIEVSPLADLPPSLSGPDLITAGSSRPTKRKKKKKKLAEDNEAPEETSIHDTQPEHGDPEDYAAASTSKEKRKGRMDDKVAKVPPSNSTTHDQTVLENEPAKPRPARQVTFVEDSQAPGSPTFPSSADTPAVVVMDPEANFSMPAFIVDQPIPPSTELPSKRKTPSGQEDGELPVKKAKRSRKTAPVEDSPEDTTTEVTAASEKEAEIPKDTGADVDASTVVSESIGKGSKRKARKSKGKTVEPIADTPDVPLLEAPPTEVSVSLPELEALEAAAPAVEVSTKAKKAKGRKKKDGQEDSDPAAPPATTVEVLTAPLDAETPDHAEIPSTLPRPAIEPSLPSIQPALTDHLEETVPSGKPKISRSTKISAPIRKKPPQLTLAVAAPDPIPPADLPICPLCETPSTHLPHLCPVVQGGPSTLVARITELEARRDSGAGWTQANGRALALLQNVRAAADKAGNPRPRRKPSIKNLSAPPTETSADSARDSPSVDIVITKPAAKPRAKGASKGDAAAEAKETSNKAGEAPPRTPSAEAIDEDRTELPEATGSKPKARQPAKPKAPPKERVAPQKKARKSAFAILPVPIVGPSDRARSHTSQESEGHHPTPPPNSITPSLNESTLKSSFPPSQPSVAPPSVPVSVTDAPPRATQRVSLSSLISRRPSLPIPRGSVVSKVTVEEKDDTSSGEDDSDTSGDSDKEPISELEQLKRQVQDELHSEDVDLDTFDPAELLRGGPANASPGRWKEVLDDEDGDDYEEPGKSAVVGRGGKALPAPDEDSEDDSNTRKRQRKARGRISGLPRKKGMSPPSDLENAPSSDDDTAEGQALLDDMGSGARIPSIQSSTTLSQELIAPKISAPSTATSFSALNDRGETPTSFVNGDDGVAAAAASDDRVERESAEQIEKDAGRRPPGSAHESEADAEVDGSLPARLARKKPLTASGRKQVSPNDGPAVAHDPEVDGSPVRGNSTELTPVARPQAALYLRPQSENPDDPVSESSSGPSNNFSQSTIDASQPVRAPQKTTRTGNEKSATKRKTKPAENLETTTPARPRRSRTQTQKAKSLNLTNGPAVKGKKLRKAPIVEIPFFAKPLPRSLPPSQPTANTNGHKTPGRQSQDLNGLFGEPGSALVEKEKRSNHSGWDVLSPQERSSSAIARSSPLPPLATHSSQVDQLESVGDAEPAHSDVEEHEIDAQLTEPSSPASSMAPVTKSRQLAREANKKVSKARSNGTNDSSSTQRSLRSSGVNPTEKTPLFKPFTPSSQTSLSFPSLRSLTDLGIRKLGLNSSQIKSSNPKQLAKVQLEESDDDDDDDSEDDNDNGQPDIVPASRKAGAGIVAPKRKGGLSSFP